MFILIPIEERVKKGTCWKRGILYEAHVLINITDAKTTALSAVFLANKIHKNLTYQNIYYTINVR